MDFLEKLTNFAKVFYRVVKENVNVQFLACIGLFRVMWFSVKVTILQNFARFQNLYIFCWSDYYIRLQSCFIMIWVNWPFLGIDRFEKFVLFIEVTQVNDYHYARNKISLASKLPWGQGPQCDLKFWIPCIVIFRGLGGWKFLGTFFGVYWHKFYYIKFLSEQLHFSAF